jgi:peptidoglycan/LPS O-acetylase OafA/YrhL
MKVNIVEINGFRGFAAIFVLLFHYTFLLNPNLKFGFLFHYGYMGVSLFFIISGFLITDSIYSNSSKSFVIKRIFRLYPVYWISIFLTIITYYISSQFPSYLDIKVVVFNLSMFQRFFGVKDIDGAYWTLAVELIFYFILILIKYFNRLNNLFNIFLFLILIIFILNLIFKIYFPENFMANKVIKQLSYFHLFLAGIVFRSIFKNNVVSNKNLFILILVLIINLGTNLRFNILIETLYVFVFLVFFLLLNFKIKFLQFFNSSILQFFNS